MGELVQRLGGPNTTYGLALPDNRQYRGLVERLPTEARRRIVQIVYFVDADGNVRTDDAG